MIFVTVGTCVSFHRLVKHIDFLAVQLNEDIVMQTGESTYDPVNCEFSSFFPSLDHYIGKARLVISHGGFSCIEIIKQHKPLIIVPRQHRYQEHMNDHQVEFAELLHRKFDVPYFTDLDKLSAEYISEYSYVAEYKYDNLNRFKENIKKVLCAGKSSRWER